MPSMRMHTKLVLVHATTCRFVVSTCENRLRMETENVPHPSARHFPTGSNLSPQSAHRTTLSEYSRQINILHCCKSIVESYKVPYLDSLLKRSRVILGIGMSRGGSDDLLLQRVNMLDHLSVVRLHRHVQCRSRTRRFLKRKQRSLK